VNTTSKPHWIDAWLETQQGWLGRWQATAVEQRVDATRAGMETWRKQFDPANPSSEMLNVVQSFQSLLQACAVQSTQAQQSTSESTSTPFAQIMQALSLGHGHERQLEWQRYLNALGEYQQSAAALIQHFVNVFTQSLQQVPAEVEQRQQANQPVQSIRELYDLWIECGERCFADVAKSEDFVSAQAAHTNALSRLRLAERVLLERWMQQYDLPTRSEVNSLHQKMRDMTYRITELEQQLADKVATTRKKKS